MYEARIDQLEEEIAYLRTMVGIHSKPVEPEKETPVDPQAKAALQRYGLSEQEEELEWEYLTGRKTTEEYQQELEKLGLPFPVVKSLE